MYCIVFCTIIEFFDTQAFDALPLNFQRTFSVTHFEFWVIPKRFLTKATIFCCLMYFLYDYPKYSRFKRKYQQIQPVCPDYLSVSCDYGTRNLDKYFHFYRYAGQKFKMKEIFFKKLNSFWWRYSGWTPLLLLTLRNKPQKTAYFGHKRYENDFEMSTYFLTYSNFKK